MAGLVPPEAAIVREDTGERLDWAGLLKAGYVRHLHLSNADVERAFAGSRFAAEDEVARARPDDRFADLWFAYLHVPTIGVSLLGEAGFRRLKDRLYDGEQAVLVMSSGRWSFTGEDFVRGTVPDRLALRQGSFPVALRDADLEIDLAPGIPVPEEMKIFKIDRQAGFDPGSPWTLAPHVTRSRGMFQPETGSRDFSADYALPARFFERPGDADEPPWLGTWRLLASELGVLGVALAGLSAGLAMQRRLTRNGRAFVALRLGFLAFTLGFVGWYAQGQLSIVSVLGLVKAAVG